MCISANFGFKNVVLHIIVAFATQLWGHTHGVKASVAIFAQCLSSMGENSPDIFCISKILCGGRYGNRKIEKSLCF